MIKALHQQGKTGVQIATVLRDQDFALHAVKTCMFSQGYVVAVYPLTEGQMELHVSNWPLKAGIAAVVAAMEPRALPSVIWSQEE